MPGPVLVTLENLLLAVIHHVASAKFGCMSQPCHEMISMEWNCVLHVYGKVLLKVHLQGHGTEPGARIT